MMKKFSLSFIIALIFTFMFVSVSVFADDTQEENIEIHNDGIDEAEMIVASGTCEGTNTKWQVLEYADKPNEYVLYFYVEGDQNDVIPGYYSSFTSSYKDFKAKIHKVEISDGITEIGEEAFRDFSKLEMVNIPETVTKIGDYAFYNCSIMERIKLPSALKSIGNSTFSGCNILKSIYIPDNVESIGSYAVSGVTIVYCSRKEAQYSWSENWNGMAEVHYGCTKEEIEFYVGTDFTASEIISIPSGITFIPTYAFMGCDKLKHVIVAETVTTIGDNAFWGCSSLEKIDLPFALDTVGNYAFLGCDSLKTIYIPGHVESMGHNVFDPKIMVYCGRPEAPETWDEQWNGDDWVGYAEVEYGCTKDIYDYYVGTDFTTEVEIEIPEGATFIPRNAFKDCSELKRITIPETVTTIGYGAFSECGSLEKIALPSTLTSIGSDAFLRCDSLKAIYIPDNVINIGENALSRIPSAYCSRSEAPETWKERWNGGAEVHYGCTKAVYDYYVGTDFTTEVEIEIPEGITFIPRNAFKDCSELKRITIPETVTTIGDSAFSGCSSLEKIALPSKLVSIGSYVFEECNSLKTIYVSDRVESIGYRAFGFGITIYFGGLEIPETWDEDWNGVYWVGYAEVHYGCTKAEYDYYVGTDFTTEVEIEIPEGVTFIPQNAFDGCSELKRITIPETVTTIESNAFADCVNLESVKLPDTLISINQGAFLRCSSLESIDLPFTLNSIGNHAFWGCNSLKAIYIPDNVKRIEKYAFSTNTTVYCSGLEASETWEERWHGSADVQYGCTREEFDYYAGTDFTKEEEIEIPSGITFIPRNAFNVCSKLKRITIPETVTTIGYGAFSGCGSLEKIALPSTLTSIGDYAFWGCDRLKAVYIPDSVTSIGEYVFCWATTLYCSRSEAPATWSDNWNGDDWTGYAETYYDCPKAVYEYYVGTDFTKEEEIEIPSGITFIPAYAFRDCSELKRIVIPETVRTIGGYAFLRCNSLREVELPSSLTSIGKGAFSECSGFESIELPPSLNSIGDSAFAGCDRLKAVYIPDSVIYLGNYVFGKNRTIYCTRLEAPVTWSENWNGDDWTGYAETYYDCPKAVYEYYVGTDFTKEEEIEIPSGITFIPAYAFRDCSELKRIIIPETVTTIGYGAFSGCGSLEKIALPSTLTSIGDYAFWGCDRLKAVYIPDSVIYLGNYVFGKNITIYCSRLEAPVTWSDNWNGDDWTGYAETYYDCPKAVYEYYVGTDFTKEEEIEIPSGITFIPRNAFKDCSELKRITIPDTVTTIGSRAFGGCSCLEKLYVGRNIETLGDFILDNAPNVTVYCYPDTKMEKYAIECNIKYVYINETESGDNTDPGENINPGDNTDPGENINPGDNTNSGENINPGGNANPEDNTDTEDNLNVGDESGFEDNTKPTEESKPSDNIKPVKPQIPSNPAILPIIDDKGDIISEDIPDSSYVFKEIWIKGYSDTEYTGMPITFDDLRVYDGTTLLIKNVDYKISYKNNKNVGVATIVVAGKGNYDFVKECSFNITEERVASESIKKAQVLNFNKTMTYTGQKLTQDGVELKLGDKVLKKDVEYSVSYKSNVNAGTATVFFRGIGEYGGVIQKSFKITPLLLTGNNVLTCEYSSETLILKSGAIPDIKVSFQGKILRNGVDYTLSFRNNKKIGIANFVINGKGNFKGKTNEYSYNVVAKDISKLSIRVPDVPYKNKAKIYKSKPTVVDADGKVLKAGRDYEKNVEYTYQNGAPVSDTDIILEGTVIYAKVYGKGDYGRKDSSEGSGYLIGSFRIINAKNTIAKAQVTINKEQYYDGTEKTFAKEDLSIMVNGTKLSAEEFEIVSYLNNTKKGTASCIIHGLGNYGGFKVVKFSIMPRKGILTDAEKTAILAELGTK